MAFWSLALWTNCRRLDVPWNEERFCNGLLSKFRARSLCCYVKGVFMESGLPAESRAFAGCSAFKTWSGGWHTILAHFFLFCIQSQTIIEIYVLSGGENCHYEFCAILRLQRIERVFLKIWNSCAVSVFSAQVLTGHTENAEYALALSPTSPLVLSGGRNQLREIVSEFF